MILLALHVQAQVILNVPLARQGIFYSHHQQLVSTLVQLDIVETLQLKLVYNAMFLVQVVLEQEIINVSLANQGIFCSRRQQQLVLTVVLQLDIGRIPQTTNACLAILLAQLVRTEAMSYVQIAKLDISCSRHQQYAWTLVRQLDIGKTQQITFAQVVMFLVHNAQVLSTLNAPLALQVMFCSHRQPHVLRRAPQAQVLTAVTIVSIYITTPHVSLIVLQGIIQIQPITNAMKVMKVYTHFYINVYHST